MNDRAQKPGLLSSAATVALIAGAVGAMALFLAAARNTPAILIFLYTGWILLPHVSLALGTRMMARRSDGAGRLMNVATLLIVAAAIAAYVVTGVMQHAPRRAAVFLMVPLGCQLLAAIAYAIAAARAGVPSSGGNQG